MNALNQLIEKASKRKAKLKRQREEKEGEERELQRVKEEAFKTIGAIYIEPLTSRSPPIFQKNNENSKDKKTQDKKFLKH